MIRALFTAISVTVVCVSPGFLLGPLSLQIDAELQLSEMGIGASVAAFRGTVMLTAPLLGRLVVDRLGASLSMRVGCTVAGVAAVSIWLVVRDFRTLVAAVVVGGIASALGQTAVNAFLPAAIHHSKQGLAFGVQQAAAPTAALMGGLIVPVVVLTLGWRYAFAVTAFLAFVTAWVVPAHRGSGASSNVSSWITRPGLPLLLAAGLGLGFGATSGLTTFVVPAAVRAGFSLGQAAVLFSVCCLLAVATRVSLGQRIDRYAGSSLQVVGGMLAVGVVGHLLLSLGSQWAVILGCVVALGIGWGFTGVLFYSLAQLQPDNIGTRAGIVLMGGSLGGALGPLTFGAIVTNYSYEWAWLASASWMALGALVILVGQFSLRLPTAEAVDVRADTQ